VVTIHHDTVADHKPQTRTGAALGGEEWLENAWLNFRWDAGAVVCDFGKEVIAIAPSANIDAALTFGGVDGVRIAPLSTSSIRLVLSSPSSSKESMDSRASSQRKTLLAARAGMPAISSSSVGGSQPAAVFVVTRDRDIGGSIRWQLSLPPQRRQRA
jgi:hypothetical protein